MAPVTHTGPSSPAVSLGTTKMSTKLVVFARCVQNHPDLSRLLQKDMREMTQDVCQLVTGQLPTVEELPGVLQQTAELVKAALAELRSEKKSIFALTIQKIHEIDEIAHAHATGVLYDELLDKGIILEEHSSNTEVQRAAIAAVDVVQVKELNLSRKGLRCVPIELSRFTALQKLNLSHNQLTNLPSGLFANLIALQKLNLSYNQITRLPGQLFDNSVDFEQLDLSYNLISRLPDHLFDNLVGLEQLDLSHNQISLLPPGIFDSLTALTELNLKSNQLTSLPNGVFDKLRVLRRLYLGFNQLSSLPDKIFDNLTALQYLWFNNNQLTSLLDDCFDNLIALNWLSLEGNQFTRLSSRLFANLTVLQTLSFSGNRLEERPLLPVGVNVEVHD